MTRSADSPSADDSADTGCARLHWLGHASVVIETDGVRVVTDPLLARTVAHLRRRVPLPAVPAIDAVLISHVHMDHLHLPSLRRIAPGTRLVVPRGAARLVRSLGAPVDEVVPGDRLTVCNEHGSVTVRVVHAEHLDGRGPHSRVRAHPVGYVVEGAGTTAYFGGDTDLFDAMSDLGHPDVALLPIWGWGPTLGEKHLDPTSAAQATALIQPRFVVPIHWGTYSPLSRRRGAPPWIDTPSATFAARLGDVGLVDRLRTVTPGGSLTWSTQGDSRIDHSGGGV